MKLVADANVLLSAALGGRANLVLEHPGVGAVFTTAAVFSEVEEYAPIVGRKRRLSLDTLMLTVAALPVTVAEPASYKSKMPQARALLEQRDPDDVELLALALHLQFPLWSNDSDFEDCGVEWLTTAELLFKLGISRKEV